MTLKTKYIKINTKGNSEVINITPYLEEIVKEEKLVDGILFLSVIGSTAGLTTIEYEPALVKDLKNTLEKLLPYREDYNHNFTWNDANAHSHLRSSFIKTQFFVSITKGKLDLGTWQQVVLIDFDIRERERKIVVKIISD